jgi:hypothetical protein
MKTALAAISPNGACSRKKSPIHKAQTRRTAPKKDHIFSLGIAEEFQIIDPETRELRSHVQQILADGKIILKEQIKPELHQSIVEIGTEISPHWNSRCFRKPFRVRRLLKTIGFHRLH